MTPDARPPEVLVLTNPRITRRMPGLVDTLKTNLQDASVESIEGPTAMVERARAAVAEGVQRIVVAGGDGTVGLLLRAFAGGEPAAPRPTFGVIPIGTYNNFARALGVPTSVADACSVIGSGRAAAIDLGRVTSRYPPTSFIFKEVVGVGVDANAFASGLDVAGPAKIPVGALATVNAILRFRPYPVKYRFDPHARWQRCTQLLVANTPTCAAAFPVLPEARLDDGLFHVLSRSWRGRLDLLTELPRILSGRHCELEHDQVRTARSLYVTGHSSVLLHADGEFFCRMPATIEMLPAAVQMLLPAHA